MYYGSSVRGRSPEQMDEYRDYIAEEMNERKLEEMAEKKNYFDDKGNYINVENLTLRQIYERGFDEGYKRGYPDGALHNLGGVSKQISDISAMTDNLYNKLMGGGV